MSPVASSSSLSLLLPFKKIYSKKFLSLITKSFSKSRVGWRKFRSLISSHLLAFALMSPIPSIAPFSSWWIATTSATASRSRSPSMLTRLTSMGFGLFVPSSRSRWAAATAARWRGTVAWRTWPRRWWGARRTFPNAMQRVKFMRWAACRGE